MSRLRLLFVPLILLGLVAWTEQALASPFGQGVFGEDVPFGAATSISIALGGDVSFGLTPSGGNYAGNGAHTLTVTSTDVVGYSLYARALNSSNMTNGSAVIPASSNSSPAALAVDTWGYNTTGSTTNFAGLTTNSTLIKDATGPYKNGDDTTVTYGVLTSSTKESGAYNVSVVYTVVAKNP